MNLLDYFTVRAAGRPRSLQSEKAPAGALAVTSFQSTNQPIHEPYSTEAAIKKAYYGNVYAYRCVDAIANSIVGCPWRAGDPVTFNYRLTPPLARLLGPAPGSPNPMWSSASMLRYAVASYILMGKFAWAIERDSIGRVVGLWPLRAQHVYPIPATTGNGYFSAFDYGIPGSDGYRRYKPDDIVYVWRPAISDFRMPESPVQIAGLNISIARVLDSFDYNFLSNGAVPATLVVTPPFANDLDRKAFQQQFMADFGGAKNAGKSIFAERTIEGEGPTGGIESIDVKPLGVSQRDAELSALSQKEIMAITVAFGVPLSILGDSSHRTFSNAFQDRRNYWLETLLPRAREIADGINTHLAPLLDGTGRTVGWFDTSGVPELRPEPAIPYQVSLDWVKAEIIKLDELRADVGLPPAADVGLSGELLVQPVPAALSDKTAPSDSLAGDAGVDTVPPVKAPVATAPAASRKITQLVDEQRTVIYQQLTGRRSKEVKYDKEFWKTRLEQEIPEISEKSQRIVDISELIIEGVTLDSLDLVFKVVQNEIQAVL